MSAFVARLTTLLSLVLPTFFSGTVQAAERAREIDRFYSGRWEVVAYADDTGNFSDCSATAANSNDIMMLVMVDRTYTWGLGLGRSAWKLKIGTEIPLKFRIDQSPWLDTKAVVAAKNVVAVPMEQEVTLVELFRHGHVLQLYDGGILDFDLTGTAKLMADLGVCVETSLAAENGNANRSSPASREKQASGAMETESSSGSGIVISESGYILTNDHVIDECHDIWVRRDGDIGRSASVVARDAANDLALLQSDGTSPGILVASFRSGAPLRAGDSIAAYGFPLAGTLSSSGNVVSGNITAVTGVEDDVRYFQISAPVQPGNSGGPLLDYFGLVIGIVNAKLNGLAVAARTGDIPQNVNFAIKESVILGFLDAHSIDYKSAAPQEKLDLADVTDRAQRFTAYVACVR